MRTVLLALGSNIEPERNMVEAADALDELFGLEALSPVYEADPVDCPGAPGFWNAAARISTAQPARELKFDVLRPLERRMGRVRTANRNAPRTIDIDIAAIEGIVVDADGLRLPDPDILTRAHLALPLADVAPAFRHPTDGRRLDEIAAGFRVDQTISRRDHPWWPRP